MNTNGQEVLNLIKDIKRTYEDRFGMIYYNIILPENKTIAEYWVECLGNDGIHRFTDIIKPLQFNQYGKLLLIRYANYSKINEGMDDITSDEFWNKHNGLYRECRSIVIDIDLEEVVILPFKKFRNLNEGEENSIDKVRDRLERAKSIEFSDKLDGSMICATMYNGKIVMSSSQSLDTAKSWRLSDAMKMFFSNPGYKKMVKDHNRLPWDRTTFIFEYISLKDAHVVKYKKEQEGLYLIGIRDNITGEQCNYKSVIEIANRYDIPSTKTFDKTLDEVLEECKILKSNEKEGFVLMIDDYMVKIKCDNYVQIHKLLDKVSYVNTIIKHIADDKLDDLMAKCPDIYRNKIVHIVNMLLYYQYESTDMIRELKKQCEAVSNDKVSFMKSVQNIVPIKYRSYVTNLYNNKPYNLFKTKSGHYKTISELGLTDKLNKILSENE